MEELYQRFCSNLVWLVDQGYLDLRWSSEHEYVYICPTCYKAFTASYSLSDSEKSKETFVTKEHVPPQKYGGAPITFTCKQCNNIAGSELDVEIGKDFEFRHAFNSSVQTFHDSKISIGESTFTGVLNMEAENDYKIQIHEHRSDPKQLEDALEKLKSGGQHDLKIRFKGSLRKNVRRALLRISHLLAFSKFGYSYLFSSSIQTINSLIDGKIDVMDYDHLFFDGSILESLPDGFYSAKFDENILCLVIIFSLHHGQNKERIIATLPKGNDDELEYCDNLEKIEGLVNANIVEIPDGDYLTDEKKIMNFARYFHS